MDFECPECGPSVAAKESNGKFLCCRSCRGRISVELPDGEVTFSLLVESFSELRDYINRGAVVVMVR